MEKDIAATDKYPMNHKRQHDLLVDRKKDYIVEITKEQIDRLIEDIDKTLRTSK